MLLLIFVVAIFIPLTILVVRDDIRLAVTIIGMEIVVFSLYALYRNPLLTPTLFLT